MLLSGWAGRGAFLAAAFPELCSWHPGLLGSVFEPDPVQLLILGCCHCHTGLLYLRSPAESNTMQFIMLVGNKHALWLLR